MIRPQYTAQVGYDIDETLWCGVNDGFQDYLLRQGHRFDVQVFRSSGGSWNAATGYSSARISEIYAEYFHSPSCPDPLPIPGAYQTLCALRDVVPAQHVVTAREKTTKSKTISQLAKHFPSCITHYSFQFTRRKNVAICQHGIDIFVEDSAVEAEIILKESDHPVWVILFINFAVTQPRLRHERLICVPTWNEVVPDIPRHLQGRLWRQAWQETQDHISNLLELYYCRAPLCRI
ncbi:MAG: hypothetical protein WD972_00570 [Candidatus Andersenbacteria bacterium]